MKKSSLTQKSEKLDRHIANCTCSQYFARLITPAEVSRTTANHPTEVKRRTAGHWVLASDVSARMYALLREAPRLNFPMRLTGFISTGGFAYCTLVHQAERHQSRIVLPLYDRSARLFLEAMTKSEHLTFLLGRDGDDEALLLNSPVNPTQYMPLLALCCPATPRQQHSAFRELPILQELMGNPLQIPSLLPRYSVQHVNVSLLLPAILSDCFQAAFSSRGGT